MSKVQNLREAKTAAPPPRSAEREALAELIERHAAALRQLAGIETAQETLREKIRAARSTVEQSASAIEEAKVNAARWLTATALGTAGAAPLSVKDARSAAQDAEDTLAASEEALSALEANHAALTQTISIQKMGLRDRAEDVVRAEAPVEKLLAVHAAAAREYVKIRKSLEFLSFLHAIPEGSGLWRNQADWSWSNLDRTAPWGVAVEALTGDADAALPE